MADNNVSTVTGTGGSRSRPQISSGSGSSSVRQSDPPVTYQVVRDMISASEEKTESKLEAIESRLDASEARINAALDGLKSEVSGMRSEFVTQLSHLPSNMSMITTMAGFSGFGILLILGILAFAGDRFDGGVQVSSVSVQQAADAKDVAEKAKRTADENDKRLGVMLDRLDGVIKRIEGDAIQK